MKRYVLSALALGFTIAAGTASAQTTPPVRYRGVVETVSPTAVDIKTRDGKTITIDLTTAKYATVTKSELSDIKPDSYIGTASVPQPDGTAKALEVSVFDNALRGVGDGSYPWDMPGSTMTNGAVGDLVVSNGRIMTVKYKGGEKKIFVPEDVPIVFVAPGDNSKVAVGTHVMAVTVKGDDGKLKAAFLLAGQNGLVPPM
jgi:hypothetical protein